MTKVVRGVVGARHSVRLTPGRDMLVLLTSLLLDSVVAALNSVRGTRLRNASS